MQLIRDNILKEPCSSCEYFTETNRNKGILVCDTCGEIWIKIKNKNEARRVRTIDVRIDQEII